MEIEKEQATVMFECLQDLSPEEFVKGIKKFCTMHKEIFPNTNVIAYVREYALIDERTFLSASEAWAQVLREISRVGAYGSPIPLSVIVAEAIKGIGWKDLCLSDNVDVVRGQFRKLYEQLVERKKKEILEGKSSS